MTWGSAVIVEHVDFHMHLNDVEHMRTDYSRLSECLYFALLLMKIFIEIA